MTPCRVMSTIAVWLVVGAHAYAQPLTAAIAGTVTSDDGSGLADVTIVVQDRAIGVRRTAVTDRAGHYAITNLPLAGDYDVRAERAGFGPAERRHVTPLTNENAPI